MAHTEVTLVVALLTCCHVPMVAAAEPSVEGAPTAVSMSVGETKTLSYPESATVRVSRRGVVDVFHVGGAQWTMSALRGGIALVEATDAVTGDVLSPRLMVTVQAKEQSRGGSTLPRWLCAEPGITCRAANGEISGRTTSWEWFDKAKTACDQRADCLFRVMLTGDDAGYLLKARVYLVEDETARRLGFDGRADVDLSTAANGWSAALLSRLESLEMERDVHVVGRPVLRLLPGTKADVLSGGEFQVGEPDDDGRGWRSSWKQTGLALTVDATPISPGVARLHLKSSLKSRQSGKDASLSVSSVDSHFDVRLGRPTLAAALDLESRESVTRGNLLRDLPIIGPLFRSSGSGRSHSRLLVWLELESDP